MKTPKGEIPPRLGECESFEISRRHIFNWETGQNGYSSIILKAFIKNAQKMC